MFRRKTVFWTVVVAVVILIGVGIGLGFSWFGSDESDYTAVYMSTGDVYFGQMHWFPRPHMDNAYYLQRGMDSKNQPQIAISAMKDVFWGPSKTIYFNSKDIVLWSKLRADSSVAKYLANPTAYSAPQGNTGGLPPAPAPAGTSTAP